MLSIRQNLQFALDPKSERFSFAFRKIRDLKLESLEMDNQAVNEAIEILLNNFTRHPAFGQNSEGKINVFEALQEFWQMKSELDNENQKQENNIVYEFVEKPGPPYVCFATLPGGACFASFQV